MANKDQINKYKAYLLDIDDQINNINNILKNYELNNIEYNSIVQLLKQLSGYRKVINNKIKRGLTNPLSNEKIESISNNVIKYHSSIVKNSISKFRFMFKKLQLTENALINLDYIELGKKLKELKKL